MELNSVGDDIVVWGFKYDRMYARHGRDYCDETELALKERSVTGIMEVFICA